MVKAILIDLDFLNRLLKIKDMIKVVIYRYRQGSVSPETLLKEFKTVKSLYSFLRKIEDSPRYDSVEWHYVY